MEYRANDEREINLLEIMWEFLIQWKPVVVFSIIVSILITGLMYARDVRAYNKALVTYRSSMGASGTDLEGGVEKAAASLTVAERFKVENTIYNKKTLASNEEKLSRMDKLAFEGDKLPFIVIRFKIETSEMPLPNIMGAYSDAVYSDKFKETLEAEEAAFADIAKITDIATLSDSSGAANTSFTLISDDEEEDIKAGTFAVNIMLPVGADEKKIEEAATKYLTQAGKEITGKIPHELTLISVSETSYVNTVLSDRVTALRTATQTLRGTIATDEAAFTDAQKQMYGVLLVKEGLADSYNADIDAGSSGKADTDKSQEDQPVSADGSTPVDGASVVTQPKPASVSPKYAVAGFIAGLFIYALIILCTFIFKGRVRSLDEVTDCYRIRGIDEVHERRFDTAWRKFVYSKALYDLHFNKAGKSLDSHISDAKRYISESAAHNELKHVTLIPAYADASEDGLCRKYTDGFKKSWDAEIPMEVSGNWTTEYTTEAPGEREGIVILMHAGDTAFKTLEHIGAYCKDYGATVLGTVLLEG